MIYIFSYNDLTSSLTSPLLISSSLLGLSTKCLTISLLLKFYLLTSNSLNESVFLNIDLKLLTSQEVISSLLYLIYSE